MVHEGCAHNFLRGSGYYTTQSFKGYFLCFSDRTIKCLLPGPSLLLMRRAGWALTAGQGARSAAAGPVARGIGTLHPARRDRTGTCPSRSATLSLTINTTAFVRCTPCAASRPASDASGWPQKWPRPLQQMLISHMVDTTLGSTGYPRPTLPASRATSDPPPAAATQPHRMGMWWPF